MKYVKFMILYDLSVLPLPAVALWYFCGVGVVDMLFDAFWYCLCNIVVSDGFESLILDLCGYILICAMDG